MHRSAAAALALLLAATPPALGADPVVAAKAAWAPGADKGEDTSLYMTVANAGADEAIVRVRCEAANFTELRTVDHGEGFPSARAVKAIPLAAQRETLLTPESFHVRLLQLTRTVISGQPFDCIIRLRNGTQQTVSVEVRPSHASPE